MCRSCLRGVAWFSYWFNNLVLITEGNTFRSYAASSLPLWGNTDVVQANSNDIYATKSNDNHETFHRDVSVELGHINHVHMVVISMNMLLVL